MALEKDYVTTLRLVHYSVHNYEILKKNIRKRLCIERKIIVWISKQKTAGYEN